MRILVMHIYEETRDVVDGEPPNKLQRTETTGVETSTCSELTESESRFADFAKCFRTEEKCAKTG